MILADNLIHISPGLVLGLVDTPIEYGTFPGPSTQSNDSGQETFNDRNILPAIEVNCNLGIGRKNVRFTLNPGFLFGTKDYFAFTTGIGLYWKI